MTDMSLEGKCPDEFYCSDGSHGYSAISDLHKIIVPAIASFVSAVVSILGATLILFVYCAFKDLRKGTAQKIITLLALADIGTAISLMLGNLNLLVYRHYRSDISASSACLNFYLVCQIQAFLVLEFSISGYAWTALLAVHFLLATVLSHSNWTGRLMPLYNTVAWTLPFIVSLPLLLSGKLGYTPTFPTTCYISAYAADHTSSEITLTVEEEIVWGVETVCAIITVVCFVVIIAYICCKVCAYCVYNYDKHYVDLWLYSIIITFCILRCCIKCTIYQCCIRYTILLVNRTVCAVLLC